MRSRYGPVFAEISAILFRHDPIGINFESNTDEYDSEAETILNRLHPGITVEETATIVREEFVRWFGEEMAAETADYTEIAREIAAAYQAWRDSVQ